MQQRYGDRYPPKGLSTTRRELAEVSLSFTVADEVVDVHVESAALGGHAPGLTSNDDGQTVAAPASSAAGLAYGVP